MYSVLATGYQSLGLDHLADAEKTLEQAAGRKLDTDDLRADRYNIAFLKADRSGMEREAVKAQGKSGAEAMMSDKESLVLAYFGHLQQARAKSRRAVDLAEQAAQRETAAQYEAGAAVREALFGNAGEAKHHASAALELSKNREVEYGAALALCLAGDTSSAETRVNDLEKRFGEDTSVRFSYLPTVRALLALKPRKSSKAIELLQAAVPYQFGRPRSSIHGFFGALYPIYVRGLAYLEAGQGAEAAAEFEKILDSPGIVVSDPMGPLARWKLGEAFYLSGNKTRSKRAYEDFLTLWKDADPDIPILKQAKAEYARLPRDRHGWIGEPPTAKTNTAK